jgi:hypothetical protein
VIYVSILLENINFNFIIFNLKITKHNKKDIHSSIFLYSSKPMFIFYNILLSLKIGIPNLTYVHPYIHKQGRSRSDLTTYVHRSHRHGGTYPAPGLLSSFWSSVTLPNYLRSRSPTTQTIFDLVLLSPSALALAGAVPPGPDRAPAALALAGATPPSGASFLLALACSPRSKARVKNAQRQSRLAPGRCRRLGICRDFLPLPRP